MYYGLLLEEGREREYLINSYEEGRGWENRRPTQLLDRLEEKEDPVDSIGAALHPRRAALLSDEEYDRRVMDDRTEVESSGEERKVAVDAEAEFVLDDNEEVLLDTSSPVESEGGRGGRTSWKTGGKARKVRWGTVRATQTPAAQTKRAKWRRSPSPSRSPPLMQLPSLR